MNNPGELVKCCWLVPFPVNGMRTDFSLLVRTMSPNTWCVEKCTVKKGLELYIPALLTTRGKPCSMRKNPVADVFLDNFQEKKVTESEVP